MHDLDQELAESATLLHKRFPVGDVDVQLGCCDGDRAACHRLSPGEYIIRIDPEGRSPDDVMDLLCHEWAHAMCWEAGKERKVMHSCAWGAAYSKCYRVVFRV